jgi:hypothetical protein
MSDNEDEYLYGIKKHVAFCPTPLFAARLLKRLLLETEDRLEPISLTKSSTYGYKLEFYPTILTLSDVTQVVDSFGHHFGVKRNILKERYEYQINEEMSQEDRSTINKLCTPIEGGSSPHLSDFDDIF